MMPDHILRLGDRVRVTQYDRLGVVTHVAPEVTWVLLDGPLGPLMWFYPSELERALP